MADFSWDDAPIIQQAPKQYSTLHNLVVPGLNELSKTANWVIGQGRNIGKAANLPPELLGGQKKVPIGSYNPGVASTISKIGGFMLPYEGEMRLAQGATHAAQEAIPLLAKMAESKALRGAGRIGRAGGVGITTAVPARDPSTSATAATLQGGLGGAGGEVVGGIASKLASPLLRQARFNNFKNAFLSGATHQLPQAAQRDALNDVVDAYQGARQGANQKYQPIWDKLEARGQSLTPDEMQRTLGLINKDGEKSLLKADDLPWNERGQVDPQQFHFERAKMEQAANKSQELGDIKSNQEARRGFKYSSAMKQDLNDFLDKNKMLDQYEGAQSNWKRNVLPYIESKIFKKHIYPEIQPKEEEIHHLPGQELNDADIQRLKDTAPISKIAKKFLPGGEEATDNVINEFSNLLGKDKSSAVQHVRNLLFSKHYDGDEMDMTGLAKTLGKLKGENRDLILNPKEQDQLKEMGRLGKLKLSPWKKSLLGLAAGGMVGHHFLGHPEGLIGAGTAGIIGQHYLEPAIKDILGSAPFRVAERGLQRKLPIPGLGAALASTVGEYPQ